MTKDKELIDKIRNEFIEYCRNRNLIVPLFSKKVNMVVMNGFNESMRKALSSAKVEIEELKKREKCDTHNNMLIYCDLCMANTLDRLNKDFKHQLQTQRDDIFKEIDEGVTDLNTEYLKQYFKDSWEETAIKWFNAYDKLENTIEHLKQKHKEGKWK